jgi:hypothetical protein
VAGAIGLAFSAWAPAASAQAAKPAKGAAAKGGDAKDKDKDAGGGKDTAGKDTAGKDAGGKPDLAAAKKHFGEGDKKFKAGDFSGALVEFKAANEIKSAPQAERYIGMCEDSLGHYSAAVEWYEKFLAHVPEKMKDQGDEIKKREGEIKALPGKVHFDSTPPGADVTVDGKPQASPTPLDAELPAGIHKVVFTAKGRVTTSKAVDVEFASTQTISATLDADAAAAAPPPPPAPSPIAAAPVPAAAPPPPPPPEPRSKVPAFITGGLAVVAAGVGTAFGVIALGDKSNYDKNPTSSTADNGDTHALIADMAFGVAITFGVTSAVLFLTGDEPPPAAAARGESHTFDLPRTASAAPSKIKITPTPMVGPHTGGAGVLVQF